MKISLVFPPPFDTTQPYLSLPMLSALLENYGYQTVQRDLNIEVFDHLVSSATLTQIYQRICKQLTEARRSDPTQAARISALERAKRISPTLIARCSDIKTGFRTREDFFNPAKYFKSVRLLQRVCETVSAAHYPTVLTPVSYRMRYRVSSMAEILAALDDERDNLFLAPFRDVFVPSLLEGTPDLFGFSVVYSDQIIPALTLAQLLKRANRGTRIIIGGDVFSRMVRTSLAGMTPLFDLVDAFVIDDGMQPLLSLCERLQEGRSFDSIPGVIASENDCVLTTPSAFVSSPTPNYDGLATDLYFSPEPIVPLLAGKGCSWGKCVFCNESFAKQHDPKTIPSLMKDIDCLVSKDHVKTITFADVDIPVERLRELATALLTRDYRISWSCRARLVKGIDYDLCELIARAGCRKLYFGLESASQRILNKMRKGIRIDLVPEILRCCWENGIATHLFSFVGFPGETREEARMTTEFIIANRKYVSSFNIGDFCFLTFSKIFKEAERYGVKYTRDEHVDADLDDRPYAVEQGMSMEDANELSYLLARETYEWISKDDDSFEIFPDSRYIKKKGVPAFDSHNLAYLAEYSNRWTSDNGAALPRALDGETTLVTQPFIEVQKEPEGICVVFSPETGKLLRLPVDAIELLKACDGRTSIRSLMSRNHDAGSPPDRVLAFFARALGEGIVAEVNRP